MSSDVHECIDGAVKDGPVSSCGLCIAAAEDEFAALMFEADPSIAPRQPE